MTDIPTKADLAAQRLAEAVEAAKEATREANAAKKDLERARKEAHEFITGDLRATITEEMQRTMGAFNDEFPKQVQSMYAKVSEQVDLLINLAVGKPGRNGDDLRPEMAAMFGKWIGEQLALHRVPAVVVVGNGDIEDLPDDFRAQVIPVHPTIDPPKPRD